MSRGVLRRFFFQAEDGIRDVAVTGVQTCALPIYVLVALGLEDDHVGRLAAERAPEADRPQARRLLLLVPPLARLGRQVDVGELPARLVLHERDARLDPQRGERQGGWTRLPGSCSMKAWR